MNTIDLSPLLPVVSSIAVALLSTLGAWAIKRFAAKLKLDIQGQNAELVESALNNGLNLAFTKLGQVAGPHLKIETKSQILAQAASYVTGHVPGALAALQIDGPKLAQKLEARLAGKELATLVVKSLAAPAVPAAVTTEAPKAS